MKSTKIVILLALCLVLTAQALLASAAGQDYAAQASFVFHVVDKAGKPVQNLSGTLELGIDTGDEEPPGTGLLGNGVKQYVTGEDGNLYYIDEGITLPTKGTLIIGVYYDNTIEQRIPVEFTAGKKEMTVVWSGVSPVPPAPDPATRRITFRIVDEAGKPVANIYGALDCNDPIYSGRAVMTSLAKKEIHATDESGIMYVELGSDWDRHGRSFTLSLHAYYDFDIKQSHKVILPDPPASYKIVWKQGTPPNEYPPQTTGIRIFMVDTKGNPMQGVELGGSPHPKETKGPVPEMWMDLGASDEKGYIRWDNVTPGTYELIGRKDGQSQSFTVKMPTDKDMADVTLVWNPQAK